MFLAFYWRTYIFTYFLFVPEKWTILRSENYVMIQKRRNCCYSPHLFCEGSQAGTGCGSSFAFVCPEDLNRITKPFRESVLRIWNITPRVLLKNDLITNNVFQIGDTSLISSRIVRHLKQTSPPCRWKFRVQNISQDSDTSYQSCLNNLQLSRRSFSIWYQRHEP